MIKYKNRYFLSIEEVDDSEIEVTREQWMRAERNAGFHPKIKGEPATDGFSGNGVSGRMKSEDIRSYDLTGYGHLTPLDEFIKAIESNALIDYDDGYLATETQSSSIYVQPSNIVKILHDHPEYLEWATHVMWLTIIQNTSNELLT